MLVLILAAILVVDLAGATAAYVVHHDDPVPLPEFHLGPAPRPDAAVWVPIPDRIPVLELIPYDPDAGLAQPPRIPEDHARTALRLLARNDGHATDDELQRAGRELQRATEGMQEGLLPHQFPGLSSTNVVVPPPWFSARAQAMALTAAVQLAETTGDTKWRELADELVTGLQTFRNFRQFGLPSPGDPWVSLVDDNGYLWFEQSASITDPSFSLTAHLSGVLALDSYWRLTHDPAARRLFRGGAATVAQYFHNHRVPGGTAHDGLPDGLRDAGRQELLADQLDALQAATGDRRFQTWATDLRQDLNRPRLVDVRTVTAGPRRGVDAHDETSNGRTPTNPGNDATRVDTDEILRYALACLARAENAEDAEWIDRATDAVRAVEAVSSNGLYAHLDRARNLEYRMTPPWFSAQTQGLMLSAQSRLYALTDDEEWRRAAAETFATLLVHRKEQYAPKGQIVRWISVVDDGGYLWFERYPQGRVPSLGTTGHLYATFGVYDYWTATRNPVAAETFRAAVATMVKYLPQIRVEGQPSRVGMATGEQSLQLHRVVTKQLQLLAGMSGRSDVQTMAEAFKRDAS